MNDKNSLGFTVKSEKNFDSTVADLQTEIEKNSMRVLHVHDVQATLAQKGIVHAAFKMVEFCRADYAHAILEADSEAGIFLPCKISVYVRDGETFISAFDFDKVAHLFSDATVTKKLSAMAVSLKNIVESLHPSQSCPLQSRSEQ